MFSLLSGPHEISSFWVCCSLLLYVLPSHRLWNSRNCSPQTETSDSSSQEKVFPDWKLFSSTVKFYLNYSFVEIALLWLLLPSLHQSSHLQLRLLEVNFNTRLFLQVFHYYYYFYSSHVCCSFPNFTACLFFPFL